LCFKAILKFLSEADIHTLTIKELPFVFLHNQANNPMAYLCFKTNSKVVRTDMHSVISNNYKSFSNSRKEGYKRGLKHNLKIKETQDFDVFWNDILIPNLKEKHGVNPVHSLDEISLLKARFPENIRQFNVFFKNKIVGGTTIFESKNVAHCQYISGNANKNELGSLDYLHTLLIKDIYKDMPYFDFGTSNINNGNNINEGLQFWKEGFGAKSITQSFYEIETDNYKLLEDIFL